MAERPNLDEDKGGKLIDPTRFLVSYLKLHLPAINADLSYADYAAMIRTHEEVTSGSAQFLGHSNLLAGSAKNQKSTASISLQRLNTSHYQDGVLKFSGIAFSTARLWICVQQNSDGLDNQSAIVERKVSELYFVETKYHWLTIFTKLLPRSGLRNHYSSVGVKQMSPEPLKELRMSMSSSNHVSKERSVADSIAARLGQTNAYNFKTDCSFHSV
ncbi:hypothetical protein Tco_0318383 [Tanacetum coccineum]